MTVSPAAPASTGSERRSPAGQDARGLGPCTAPAAAMATTPGGTKFAATALWNDVLQLLATKALTHGKTKSDGRGRRQAQCLNGHDIVDWVLDFVAARRPPAVATPKRDNAKRLCQRFQDAGNLLPVGSTGPEFKARPGKWYRVDLRAHPLRQGVSDATADDFRPCSSPQPISEPSEQRAGLRRRSMSVGALPLPDEEGGCPLEAASRPAPATTRPPLRPPTPAHRGGALWRRSVRLRRLSPSVSPKDYVEKQQWSPRDSTNGKSDRLSPYDDVNANCSVEERARIPSKDNDEVRARLSPNAVDECVRISPTTDVTPTALKSDEAVVIGSSKRQRHTKVAAVQDTASLDPAGGPTEVAGVPSRPFVPYCRQMSLSEFEAVRRATTEAALHQLIDRILDDGRLPTEEKRYHLRALRARHPRIYRQHFERFRYI